MQVNGEEFIYFRHDKDLQLGNRLMREKIFYMKAKIYFKMKNFETLKQLTKSIILKHNFLQY